VGKAANGEILSAGRGCGRGGDKLGFRVAGWELQWPKKKTRSSPTSVVVKAATLRVRVPGVRISGSSIIMQT
jgi:hypothetical protein